MTSDSTLATPRDLAALLAAQHACIFIHTDEEDQAIDVVRNAALAASRPPWAWSASRGLFDPAVEDSVPVPDTTHPAAALYHLSVNSARNLAVFLDLASHLKDERTLRTCRELIAHYRRNGGTLVLVDHLELPPVIRAHSIEFVLPLPDEAALERIVRQTVLARNGVKPVQVDLTREQFATILRNLAGLSARQARQVVLDAITDDQRLDAADVGHMLFLKRKHLQGDGVLDAVEAPVSLDDIGGLKHLKAWLAARQHALDDDAVRFGIEPPRGLLLLGVQGAGKSLAARAVATAWNRPLLRLDPGRLYDRWVGESEHRLREALLQAQRMAPVVLWIDEIEKGFASAASQSTDGGLSKRMFGTLLTWMQERTAPVFLIATANDIDALPPELLRKGRFDEIFFVDLPPLDARAQIFAAHLRKRKRDPAQFDLPALAAASEGYSGAEIEQAVVAALHLAYASRNPLATAHIAQCLATSPPLSVTMRERIAALRNWARGRCVPAD